MCGLQQAASASLTSHYVFSDADVVTLKDQRLRNGLGAHVLVPFHTGLWLLVATGTLGPGP